MIIVKYALTPSPRHLNFSRFSVNPARKENIVSSSSGLDFVIRLANSNLNLPIGQVKFFSFGRNSKCRSTVRLFRFLANSSGSKNVFQADLIISPFISMLIIMKQRRIKL